MVKMRKYRRRGVPTGEWEVDVRVELPAGGTYRERKVYRDSPSRAEARAWAEEREHHIKLLTRQGHTAEGIRRLLQGGTEANDRPDVPTLSEFAPKFIEYAKANRQKASTIYAKESILRVHLVPALGTKRLDAITEEDVQSLKVRLAEHMPKTVNNVLTVLSKLLRVASRLKVIPAMPVQNFDLLKVPETAVPPFYTFEEYAALVEAAGRIDPRLLAVVRLGGDAGLRAGEAMALEQPDVSRANGVITVERQVWRGVVGAPKSGKGRSVPMTTALRGALAAVRHLRSPLVLVQDDGTMLTAKVLRGWMKSAQRLAGLKATGNFHILRHTFCSHLAMRGAPAKVIQELAGHRHLTTTMRYMHLAKGHKEQAISLLDHRPANAEPSGRGGGVEAES
jgi:integrase